MSDALGDLLARLRDPDRNVRIEAALDIGKLNEASAAEALIDALGAETDFFVRETITWSVVRLGEAATPLLMDRLGDARPSVRHDAAHALSKIGDPRAVDALIAILRDDDFPVVSKAAFALGQIGDPRAIAPLVAILGHADRELESMLNAVLERFSRAAVLALVQALAHPNWRTREQAADILRGIGDADAAPALITLLADPCWRVRLAAVNALGRLGAAREVLATLRDDEDRRVRALVDRVLTEPRRAPH